MVYTEAIYIKPDQDDQSRNGRYVPETLEFDTITELTVLEGAVRSLATGGTGEVTVPAVEVPVPVVYPVINEQLADALEARKSEYQQHITGYKRTHDPEERRLAQETLRITGDGARMLAPIALHTEGIDVEIVRAPKQEDPEIPFEQAVLAPRLAATESIQPVANRRHRVRRIISRVLSRSL